MKIKLTLPNAKPPFRANPTDIGADVYSPEAITIPPRECYFLDLGFQIEIPVGFGGFLLARSGLGSHFGIRPRNCVGAIDSKYRGNVSVMIENASDKPFPINIGDRVCQLAIIPIETPDFEVVDELDMQDDRGGGFGHSGK